MPFLRKKKATLFDGGDRGDISSGNNSEAGFTPVAETRNPTRYTRSRQPPPGISSSGDSPVSADGYRPPATTNPAVASKQTDNRPVPQPRRSFPASQDPSLYSAMSDQQSNNNDASKKVMKTPKYQFHCQLAQGSPTGIISGFTNVKELYTAIAECFEFNPSEILFCTLDTHKPDMNKLLGGQIALDNLIFAHTKGQAKEIEVLKHEDALGLTITDNGNGYAFIKRIKEDSIMARIELVNVGDHIEKIDGKSVVNCRHYEVAKMLKDIPKGATFTIRLVEPMKSPLSMVSAYRGNKKKSSGLGTGKATIRLKATGVQEGVMDDTEELAVKAIDGLLESFMGVNDADLARSIYEKAQGKNNPSEFAAEIDEAFFEFEFTDDFIYDVWGVIGDAKAGRLKPAGGQVEFDEQF